MSRATRVEFSGAIYHVMSRGVARMAVFLGDSDRSDFLERVGSIVEDGRMVVHAFCLMPDHNHLLCETPGGGPRILIHEINGGHARARARSTVRTGAGVISGRVGTRRSLSRTARIFSSARATSI